MWRSSTTRRWRRWRPTLEQHAPAGAVARIWGEASLGEAAATVAAPEWTGSRSPRFAGRRLPRVRTASREPPDQPKNPRAVFVLAPPRSGTTLLRVLLAGHPALFAPPELELLQFATLAERRAAFAGRDALGWKAPCGPSWSSTTARPARPRHGEAWERAASRLREL